MKIYIILLISFHFFYSLSAEDNFEKSKKPQSIIEKCKLDDVSISNKEKAYYSFKKAHQLITKSQERPFSDKFKQGLVCLHSAVSLEPTKARYIAFLGDTYNILGLSNMPMAKSIALDAYDEAIRLDESLNEVRIKAAIIEVNAQLYEDSLNHFEGALNNSAMYFQPNILEWMNVAYISIPQTTRGVEFYTSLLEKYPEVEILNIYKAILLKTQHNSKGAGRVLLQVISNPKSNPETVDMAYKLLAEVK